MRTVTIGGGGAPSHQREVNHYEICNKADRIKSWPAKKQGKLVKVGTERKPMHEFLLVCRHLHEYVVVTSLHPLSKLLHIHRCTSDHNLDRAGHRRGKS